MSTLDSRIPIHKAYFDFCFPIVHSDAPDGYHEYTREKMLKEGEVQIESLVENAMAKLGGLVRKSVAGMDFSDKSDCKMATVRKNSGGYQAPVTGIKNKVGDLRVIVYNQYATGDQRKFHFFYIPKWAHKTVNWIEIPFKLNHKNAIGSIDNKWWAFEISEFLNETYDTQLEAFKAMSSFKLKNYISMLNRNSEKGSNWANWLRNSWFKTYRIK